MKAILVAVLKLFGALLVFVGIMAGCFAALLLVIALVRFPPLLVAVILACWIFNRLQHSEWKGSQ